MMLEIALLIQAVNIGLVYVIFPAAENWAFLLVEATVFLCYRFSTTEVNQKVFEGVYRMHISMHDIIAFTTVMW